MSRIMIVAGGAWQCPLVKKAKSMGHYVICTNLYDNSPAFDFSDVGIVADVVDKDRNLEIARKYRPDAIMTDQSDIAVPTVAYVAEALNLKGIGVDVAQRFTNKFRMRECASGSGIPMPEYRLCHSMKEADAFLSRHGKAIIKPIDSQSSRGVHIVTTNGMLAQQWEDCIQYSRSEKALLIEQFIDGPEFTVDGLMTEKGYTVTAISQKDHYQHNPSIANKLVFSQVNPKYDYDRLRKENEQLIRSMGLPFGQTHTEYKYADGRFYLIETAARGGGTKISSDITNIMSGIDSNKTLINDLTGNPEIVKCGQSHGYAMLGFFDFKPGKVVEITGIDAAGEQAGVHDVSLDISVGDTLSLAQDDRSRCGYYIISADSMADLHDRERLLLETVKVNTK